MLEIDYGHTFKNISYSFGPEFRVIVPEISMLFLLKLKAAWDRYYDLSDKNNMNNNRLNEKFTKDCGDIIALLQSNSFQFSRFDWLSKMMSEFVFLRNFLGQEIIEDNSTFDRVSRKQGNALIRKLLSLI